MRQTTDAAMTVKGGAAYSRVHQLTGNRFPIEQKIPGFKVGATWRFKLAAIDGWLAAQLVSPFVDVPEEGRGIR